MDRGVTPWGDESRSDLSDLTKTTDTFGPQKTATNLKGAPQPVMPSTRPSSSRQGAASRCLGPALLSRGFLELPFHCRGTSLLLGPGF